MCALLLSILLYYSVLHCFSHEMVGKCLAEKGLLLRMTCLDILEMISFHFQEEEKNHLPTINAAIIICNNRRARKCRNTFLRHRLIRLR